MWNIMFYHQLADLSKQMGLSPCISLQQQYSLLNRELELDLAEVCMNEGIGVLPWSPLKGLLTLVYYFDFLIT